MKFRFNFTDVVVTAALVFILTTGCQARRIKKDEVFCKPEDHQYYSYQLNRCRECDRCWSGDEPDLKGADVGMSLHGATKCPKCRKCSEGTYNPDGDKYWNCLPCTVCTDLGMHEAQACLPTQDAKCNKTAPTVSDRLVPGVADTNENVQERLRHEGEESHTTGEVSEVLMGVAVTGIAATGVAVTGVVLLALAIYYQRKRICRKFKGYKSPSNNEERTPLQQIIIEPDCPVEKQTKRPDLDESDTSDDDHLSSLRDIRKTETLPLVPKRRRHHSCGDYQSTRNELDKNVGKNGKGITGRRNPIFHRQFSQPVTGTEVKTTEKQLYNKRPNQRCVHILAKLLAPNKKYEDFAKHMGIEKHQIELLEEEHKQRTFSAEDWSYAYISKVEQCTPNFCYNNIFEALTSLGLHDELATLQEKLRRIYM